MSKEEDVLEWLIENKSTGDDEEIIEDVTAKTLHTLIGNVDNLVVLFCKYILVSQNVIAFFFRSFHANKKKLPENNNKETSKEPRTILSVGLPIVIDIHMLYAHHFWALWKIIRTHCP